MEVYAILSWLSVNASLSYLAAAGPVTVAGRLAEVPPTAYPNPRNQIAVARVRLGGGNCMKQQARMIAMHAVA